MYHIFELRNGEWEYLGQGTMETVRELQELCDNPIDALGW